MRFSVATVVALATGALAAYQPLGSSKAVTPSPSSSTPCPSVTTEVVTEFVTYCPEATSIVVGGSTINVTGPTTLTLTSVTVTRALLSSTVTVCKSCSAAPTVSAVHSVPMGTGSPAPKVATTTTAVSPSTATAVSPKFTGGASHAVAGAGAGLAAVFGVAAFLL